jgi:hypothetical protein
MDIRSPESLIAARMRQEVRRMPGELQRVLVRESEFERAREVVLVETAKRLEVGKLASEVEPNRSLIIGGLVADSELRRARRGE